jgi:hypothetical protein
MSERNTNGAGTSRRGPYSTMTTPPPPPQPRRQDINPRSTRTSSDRRATGGLRHLARPQRPSEARKTAGLAGGDEIALTRLSQL